MKITLIIRTKKTETVLADGLAILACATVGLVIQTIAIILIHGY
jgi:hypothetical protein